MVASSPQTIILKGPSLVTQNEALAHEALSPGHLVELLSTGKVQKNDTVAGNVQVAIATEQEYLGNEITDAYASDDQVLYSVLPRGVEVYVRVPASAAAIVIGDRLEPVAGGTVQKLSTGVAIGVALEAVNNSGGGSEVFIKMQVL